MHLLDKLIWYNRFTRNHTRLNNFKWYIQYKYRYICVMWNPILAIPFHQNISMCALLIPIKWHYICLPERSIILLVLFHGQSRTVSINLLLLELFIVNPMFLLHVYLTHYCWNIIHTHMKEQIQHKIDYVWVNYGGLQNWRTFCNFVPLKI